MIPAQSPEHGAQQAAVDHAAELGADPQTAAVTGAAGAEDVVDEGPENLPMNTWVTLGLFAAFVVLFGTCASTFMFN